MKSINEFLPCVEILAFLAERSDKQHGVCDVKVVFSQPGDRLVAVGAGERRQPGSSTSSTLVSDLMTLSRGPVATSKSSRTAPSVLASGAAYYAFARRGWASDLVVPPAGRLWSPYGNAAIDGNRSLRASFVIACALSMSKRIALPFDRPRAHASVGTR